MIENQTQQYTNDSQEEETLSLNDLLVDEKANILSEYLSLSITNLGEDTQVSVTTTGAEPATYTSVFYGVTSPDIQALIFDVHSDN
jgi:hypothetical protein